MTTKKSYKVQRKVKQRSTANLVTSGLLLAATIYAFSKKKWLLMALTTVALIGNWMRPEIIDGMISNVMMITTSSLNVMYYGSSTLLRKTQKYV